MEDEQKTVILNKDIENEYLNLNNSDDLRTVMQVLAKLMKSQL